ncbi:hypothetical protein RJ639_036258 [Escallonia herrerae]|uniref:GATA transcription factor n=1 Tax=Escallonia herrerae TaxID=1293975 RepID=A0AA88WQL0_9ASTE|nr:hypothetical protein RJ639_036258 [Escallonia herrerae]
MECVEGALTSSLRPEISLVKPTQQAFLEDLWTVNGQNGGVANEDFFVDDLLDFSKAGSEDGFADEEEEEEEKREDKKENSPTSASPKRLPEDENSLIPMNSELCVPADDMADLEWLSHFVEDSFSGYSLTYPAGKLSEKSLGKVSEPAISLCATPSFTTPVQTKARSKRARTGGRIWSLGSPYLTESSTSSSSSSCTSSSLVSNPWLIYNDPSHTAESYFGKPLPKKRKKKSEDETGGLGGAQPRRCSHCGVQKTPQWRAGPLGAKTLCNACGVRYKSGRLLPEYRPACSPTFSSEVHSNNHRKVLEMRRKKEVETGFTPPVQSF